LVADRIDCLAAQQSARSIALNLGFADAASEEIVLVVAELASNLVKHAGRGALTFRKVRNGERIGLEVKAQDNGPGISDIEKSMTDGCTTSGSLGYGLGTVNRLMDEIDVQSQPGAGTQILCRRWLRPRPDALLPHIWDVGVATRARHSAPENGDAFVLKESQGVLLVGLIDGLGHGEPAKKAALAAQQYVQTHYDQPLDKIFVGASRACSATRGVVMALARFPSITHLSFASVGNIEARASGARRVPFGVHRGILGASEPHMERHVKLEEFEWSPEIVLVLHTDGLSSRWDWNDFPALERQPARDIATKLLHELASENDDATVLCVRSVAS
jgi:anti-sigma regulatory factor (Ser/Thr protein kinase)